MGRSLSAKNLYSKKFKLLKLTGIWAEVMGQPESGGIWIVYGKEKNGKTWFSLMLAEYLSTLKKTLYVNGEEGLGQDFRNACKRAGIGSESKLKFREYTELEELDEILSKCAAPKVVFIDNITVYADELQYGGLRKLTRKHGDKLFVFVAHEERNEPYTATAKLARKLAKIIVRVQGLACFVSGRCPGGTLMIDENKALLYHGEQIKNDDVQSNQNPREDSQTFEQ